VSFNDEFNLHIIESEGDEMVHLTRFRVPQVVLFGRDQKLETPVNLSAGRHIMITAPSNSDTITISRFHADRPDEKVTTSTNLAEVIRAIGNMRASYPDVAQMLVQAEKQSNLSGRLEIDAMPAAGRIYYRTGATGAAETDKKDGVRVGDPNQVPNMFPATPAQSPRDSAGPVGPNLAQSDEASESGSASVADVSDGESEKQHRPRGVLGLFRRKSSDGNETN
jgi:hypothetical protein